MDNNSVGEHGAANKNPLVFLDVHIGEEKAGRVICELYSDVVPKTTENFRALCTGERGVGTQGKPLWFKDTIFHKAIPEFMVQGGDIIEQNGSGGESIYGGYFEDESFELKHDREGLLSMANTGKRNSNNSQFFITLISCPHLDGTNVVFGRVKSGFQIIRSISRLETQNDRPILRCRIADSGQINPHEDWGINEEDGTEDKYPPWPHDYPQLSHLEENELKTVFLHIKNSGNFYYKSGNLIDAYRKYKKAYQYLIWMEAENKLTNVENLKVISLLNLAAVEIKMKKFKDCLVHCNQVLEIDCKNVKALFRRGQSQVGLNNYNLGLKDLNSAQKLSPYDKIINSEINSVKKLISNYVSLERKAYSKMFKRVEK